MSATAYDHSKPHQIELEDLKHQVDHLAQLIISQQRQINVQQEEILTLRKSKTERGQIESQISPIHSQTLGYGDRRLLGGYDARFHSIHK